MRNKEFKHLNRAELVEIIYQLQQDNQSLNDENMSLIEQLNAREIKIKNSGSIAEAVIGLSDIFQIAQRAADDYLTQIHISNTEVETQLNARITAAQKEAEKIQEEAKRKSSEMLANATKESERMIQDAQVRIRQMLKSHQELNSLLSGGGIRL